MRDEDMGNWRRVQIIGICSNDDVPKLREALDPGKDYQNFHCLVCGGVAGLPNWADEKIDVVGNLAERDYDPRDIADQLLKLSVIAPSLRVKIHCGDDYEKPKCIKTVELYEGDVSLKEPEIETVRDISQIQLAQGLRQQMIR